MNMDELADAVAIRVRASGLGFLTLRREELRDAFGMGKFTEKQADEVVDALYRHGVFVHPHPYWPGASLRLYDRAHPLGSIIEAAVRPNDIPETPLRTAAQAFARQSAGRDLRSDDAPWLVVFDLFLQVVLGREPDGWEELRDDRHPTELARAIAGALGFEEDIVAEATTLKLAAAVCSYRPRRRTWFAEDFLPAEHAAGWAAALLESLQTAGRRLQEDHDRLLRTAARLMLANEQIPERPVELGLLGLRYRREDQGRTR